MRPTLGLVDWQETCGKLLVNEKQNLDAGSPIETRVKLFSGFALALSFIGLGVQLTGFFGFWILPDSYRNVCNGLYVLGFLFIPSVLIMAFPTLFFRANAAAFSAILISAVSLALYMTL